mmetsp:Transcript_8574/g.13244  ORF Transcript_8574/g.13244 Transcript_8574/m.13244 type:complete len:222 (+) Transcript_8574:503-1168(+)
MQRYRLVCLPQGMTEFVPVNFQDQYFSIMNCYMQSVLIDYRFRVKSFDQIRREYFQTTNSPDDQETSESVDSVADFFFGDENGELPEAIELSEVNLIYNDYIRVMTIMYEKLKNTYNTFTTRFLTEEERQSNNLFPEVGRFAHPHEEIATRRDRNITEKSFSKTNEGKVQLVDRHKLYEEKKHPGHKRLGGDYKSFDMKQGDEDLVEEEMSMMNSNPRKSK